MSSIRLLAGQVLAGLAVILALLNDSGETSSLGLALMTVGISAFILALAAFFITVEKGSLAIAGLLTLQGAVNSYAAYMARVNVGIYFGLVVLALGVVKFGVTLWSRTKGGPGSPGRASGVGSQGVALSKVASVVVLATTQGTSSWTNSTSWSDMGWWGGGFRPWLFWWLFPLLFLVVVVVVIVWLAIRTERSSARGGAGGSALRILQERYAKGEITEEQFQQMKKELQS